MLLRHRLARAAWLLASLVTLRLVGAPPAQGHPFALSGLEVWAGERDVRIELRLDGPAVLTELDRAHPLRPDRSLAALAQPTQEQLVFAYLADNLRVSNDGQPCPRQAPTHLLVHEAISKVLLELRFDCPGALDALTIESTIFNQQIPAPQVLCAFHYKRALEHYFFGGGVQKANIPVRALSQVLPATLDDSRTLDRVEPPAGAFTGSVPARPKATASSESGFVPVFVAFLGQGVLHILLGLDHLLFVVALVISVRSRRELVLVVSSFTLAHSITLVLGTFALLSASPRLVEPLIALTIFYVAVENILRPTPASRPMMTFGFGLVHGLGFSEALRELGLAPRALVGPLIGFNLGVEIGQLAIVLPLLPLVLWLRRPERSAAFTGASRVVNGVVAVLALAWFVQRIAGG